MHAQYFVLINQNLKLQFCDKASFSLLLIFLTETDSSPVSRLLHVLVIEEGHPVLVRAAHTVEAEEHGLPSLVLVEVALDKHMHRPHILKVDNMLTQLGLCVTHDASSDPKSQYCTREDV